MTFNEILVPPPPNEARGGIVDTRISEMYQVLPPVALTEKYPTTEFTEQLVSSTRQEIHNIFNGLDDRLVVISGPCSIHDPKAALEYAQRLLELRERYKEQLLVIMRVYFEKPRTTVGWKGLINDPGLDDSHDINRGLKIARKLLCDVNTLGMPAATEFLDPITVQYIDEFISWGAVGARTTESQLHRQLASGLSMPIGFKNATDGSMQIAVDAVVAAQHEHTFMSVTKMGHVAIVHTRGNQDCHIILRGGKKPNYSHQDVSEACDGLSKAKLSPRVMIDMSHSNSQKQYKRQLDVAADIASQLRSGEDRIFGVMIESNLVEGRQDLCKDLSKLVYGQSVTDACISFEDTQKVLASLNEAVLERRRINHH
ncbi:MAG: 3-deoxy-7-phosphoheptulonate synthase [Succinivibrio sp.]|nr:3-deoxy-7-phosphoheptulonate synthase [Succinivibrio sp.]